MRFARGRALCLLRAAADPLSSRAIAIRIARHEFLLEKETEKFYMIEIKVVLSKRVNLQWYSPPNNEKLYIGILKFFPT